MYTGSSAATSRTRGLSVLSSSSYSSFDDDATFSANASASTTIFNYTTVKEQLNLPFQKSADTSQWCQDLIPHDRRSSSLCVNSAEQVVRDTEKLSRRRSMDANAASSDNNEDEFTYANYDSQENSTNHEDLPFVSKAGEVAKDNKESDTSSCRSTSDFQLSGGRDQFNGTSMTLTKEIKLGPSLKSIRSSNINLNEEISLLSQIPLTSMSLNDTLKNESNKNSNDSGRACNQSVTDLQSESGITEFNKGESQFVLENANKINLNFKNVCSNSKSSTNDNSDVIKVTHSKSDEAISMNRTLNDLPKSSHSLDQQKVSTSSSFWIKKKKSLDAENANVSSESKKELPLLLSVKRLDSSIQIHRSLSDDNSDIYSGGKSDFEGTNMEKDYHDGLYISSKQREAVDSGSKPKRSIFNMSFSFRKPGLKRSTSEQVLNVSKSVKVKSLLDNNSFLSGSMAKISEDVRITDDLHYVSPSKNETAFDGIKKRMKASIRLASKKDQQLESTRNRKVSLFDQSVININRNPLKIMSIFKHWLAKHPKVFLFCKLLWF